MKNLPDGFLAQLKPLLGSGLSAFAESLEQPARRGIRLSLRRTPPQVPGCLSPIPWADSAFFLSADSTAGSHPLHDAGAYYLQEPSAMAAVSALAPMPGNAVLDLCAAPGGKASQIGDRIRSDGALVANEINPARARILARNLERMGILNAAVTCESPARLAEKLPRVFDRILVDAPCSGEGMFRREPESRLEWRPESPSGCALRQSEILRSAARMLRPGGRVVYSTCTFNETENEGVVQGFLKEHPDFHLLPFSLPGLPQAAQGMLRVWPHLHPGEGHFVALLGRDGQENEHFAAPFNRTGEAALREVSAALANWAIDPPAAGVIIGQTAYHLAPGMPSLDGLRVLRPGAALAELQGKHWKPAHALALIARPREELPVDEGTALRFQQGHPLIASDALTGWASPVLSGWPLGWGKASSGTLKNHYPKGLRRPL